MIRYPGVWAAVVLGLAFLSGARLSLDYRLQLEPTSRERLGTDHPRYQPAGRFGAGAELELVFLSSSSCGVSNHETLFPAVERAKIALSDFAEAHGMAFRAVGVALDWSAEAGAKHLAKFGTFDEVSSGYSWGNTLALRYVWGDLEARPHTPQLALYWRELRVPTSAEGSERFAESRRAFLASVSGLRGITEWDAVAVAEEAMSAIASSPKGSVRPGL